ncbi:unnamed protein product [Vitrella brassicaformis CCMP3155]|uniref:RWD domain-containing protein n=1 Tax=Vitrella brassicaformis (strain CCMP3155) TaxID=1169540 RepID=A0A0G4F6X2_VITBC|nr:unnamed protein product [Vitrella brassicaformis CCMP3155]|mmetsp:Transcript_29558/g.73607  ORF Transcript_29558/g.73607 Transcript_29558/m.73607 type:complete len:223 (-) Transcript_29558:74-742(-)|eukprot:CEM07987.1 unnamed protein product [Vitrella brassicaformis CCMP3155]
MSSGDVCEEQAMELDTLDSIFGCFENEFTVVSRTPPVHLQFRIPDPDEPSHFFLLSVTWPEGYPAAEPPSFDLPTSPANSRLDQPTRQKILDFLTAKAADMVGEQMTFALISDLKDEGFEQLSLREIWEERSLWESREAAGNAAAADGPEENGHVDGSRAAGGDGRDGAEVPDMRHLTKNQKRTMWKHAVGGEINARRRGWNWVDIISHLSKTGAPTENSGG